MSATALALPRWSRAGQGNLWVDAAADAHPCACAPLPVRAKWKPQQPIKIKEASVEQWTQKQAIDYECARECITALIGVYTSDLYAEKARQAPDQAVIDRLNAEITRLFRERQDLRLTDAAEVARVTAEYGPMVRTAMEAKRLKLQSPAQAA
jgi:hypothetical protein